MIRWIRRLQRTSYTERSVSQSWHSEGNWLQKSRLTWMTMVTMATD